MITQTEKRTYRYDRPKDGQIEERWWATLSEAKRAKLLAEFQKGWAERRARWNRTHDATRQLPRL